MAGSTSPSSSAGIQNPSSADDEYTFEIDYDNKTYRSKSFEITGSSVPAAVDNTAATIGLTRATASTPTGIQLAIKGLGAPIARSQGFFEVVLPAGFRVPAYIPATSVTVNGTADNYVGVRGQNLIIVPAQDIPAQTAVAINVLEAGGIVNPATIVALNGVSGNTIMQFKVGSNVATVNGQNVTLPLRAITDRTGYKIIFVNGNYTIYK